MTNSPSIPRFAAELRQLIADQLASPSHSLAHLDQVVRYGLDLCETYGGDPEVIAAAALLHDLGRNEKHLHGEDSAKRSVELAGSLLDSVGMPLEKRDLTLQAIGEHDQPALRPTTIEGRILKEADFLAGFGAVGIARAALWTGESGGSLDDLLNRLQTRMAARMASLEFPRSRHHAAGEYLFTRLFLEKLTEPGGLAPLPAAPYVVLEGISGAGKSTQLTLLAERLTERGYTPLTIHEPTDWYRESREALTPDLRSDRAAQLVLLLADRVLNLKRTVESNLAAGQPVLSDRSYLSSIVYQGVGKDGLTPASVAQLHTLVPQPTHIFVLDIPAEQAMARIGARGETRGDHERLDLLRQHRDRFRNLTALFPHARVLDAGTETPESLAAQIWDAVEPSLGRTSS